MNFTEDFSAYSSSNWINYFGPPTIASSRWECNGVCTSLWATPCSTTDQYAEVFWTPGHASAESLGPVICNPGTGLADWEHGYQVWLPNWSPGFVQLRKDNSPITNVTGAWTTDALVRIEKVGADIEIFCNGVSVITWTDPGTPLTGLYVGHCGAVQTNYHDNVSGGDMGGSAPAAVNPYRRRRRGLIYR